MTDDKERFDFLKMTGMGWTRGTHKRNAKYATLNRRMLAATIDSVIIMLTIAPLVDYIFNVMYGPVPLDLRQLAEQVSMRETEEEAARLYWQTLAASGYLTRWAANVAVQTLTLLVFSGICWHFWSATPGKMMVRIKIVDAKTEGPISDLQILTRLVGYLVSGTFFLVGFFWIGFDKKKQGWHDKLAETVVITLPWTPKGAKSGSEAAGPSSSPAPSSKE